MMSIEEAYDLWSGQYDQSDNKTRDLEGKALREVLAAVSFNTVLEIGCGTGKNTEWFIAGGAHVTAVDFSQKMLALARQKVGTEAAIFHCADISQEWSFVHHQYDLLSFSLVLEHIEHLPPVFEKAAKAVTPGGYLYIGELHPFKQYSGSKARFATGLGEQVLTCYTHHISQFMAAAISSGFELKCLNEYFDNTEAISPRILTLLFQKK